MATKERDWDALADRYQQKLSPSILRSLARALGVTKDSLNALGVGWSTQSEALTFPERDGQQRVIGVLRRFEDGTKKALAGGQRGLFIPRGWHEEEGIIYVPEGPTDVAALLTLGLRAVGRPSCKGGLEYLIELFKDPNDEILIVADNDLSDDNRNPGRDGARILAAALARELGSRVRWTFAPEGFKDVRSWLIEEGTHGN
jgi:hypothetical protein